MYFDKTPILSRLYFSVEVPLGANQISGMKDGRNWDIIFEWLDK